MASTGGGVNPAIELPHRELAAYYAVHLNIALDRGSIKREMFPEDLPTPMSMAEAIAVLQPVIADAKHPGRKLAWLACASLAKEPERHREARSALWGKDRDDELLGELKKLETPEARFSRTHALLSGCKAELSCYEATFHRDRQVTDIKVCVHTMRPASDFVTDADPQRWQVLAPEAFKASYLVGADDGGISTPEDEPAPATATQSAGSPYAGKLYEYAVLGLGTFELSAYRNFLNVTYAPNDGDIRVTYELSEPLSGQYGVFADVGGLDRDSGYARYTTSNSGGTDIEVFKTLRFTGPEPLPLFLNACAGSFVGPWLLLLIYLGAC